MARRHQTKSNEIASPQSDNDKLVKAALFTVNSQGIIQDTTPQARFLLNPSSIEDTKAVNWVENNIPGQSDPILQWVSGGPRNLNFTALVTRDTVHLGVTEGNPLGSLADSAVNAIGDIASNLAGVNVPALGGALSQLFGEATTGVGEELAIDGVLDYYRSLAYPVIDEEGVLQSSPPLLVLAFGKSLSALSGREVTGPISQATDLWVAKNVSIRISKWLPNLTPMEAEVTFNLTQYTIASRSRAAYGIVEPKPKSSFDLPAELGGVLV